MPTAGPSAAAFPFPPGAYAPTGPPPAGVWAPPPPMHGAPPTWLHPHPTPWAAAPAPTGSGRFVSALRGLAVPLAIIAAHVAVLATARWAGQRAPQWEGQLGLLVLFAWASTWLGGTIWMAARASAAWGVAYLLTGPFALGAYAYRSSRLGYPAGRPRFPGALTFGEVVIVAAVLAGAGGLSTPDPLDARTPYSDVDVAAVADGTPVAADGEASYAPVAMWAALLSEPLQRGEYHGPVPPPPWSDYEEPDELGWYGLWVYQDTEVGDVTFIVEESDARARETFDAYGDTPHFVEGRPSLPASSYADAEGQALVAVLVGNVVVVAWSDGDILAESAAGPDLTPEVAAERLAEGAVRRVLRLGGEPDPRTDGLI